MKIYNKNKKRISLLPGLFLVILGSFILCSACQGRPQRELSVSFDSASFDEAIKMMNEASCEESSEKVMSINDDSQTVSDNEEDLAVTVSADELSEEMETALTSYLDILSRKEDYYNNLKSPSKPTVMSGVIFEGYTRDVFFANGTPITILGPDADLSEYMHEENLQEKLGNGLGPDNRGYGAAIVWEEGSIKRYCMVSNMAEVFGGSYKDNIQGDISISFAEAEEKSAYPNISFLFGAGFGGDVLGNITISVVDALPMYVYGGGYNGDVYGDININYSGNGWSLETVGGGLAYSAADNVHALVKGNITVSHTGVTTSKINCITGGGLAISDTRFVAVADVYGDTDISVSDQNIYEICGGGMSYRPSMDAGYAMSNVYGDTSINAVGTRFISDSKASPAKSGILCGGGMSESAISLVQGNTIINCAGISFDRFSTGLYPGGIISSSNDVARACVYGNCKYKIADEKYLYNVFEAVDANYSSENMMNSLEKMWELQWKYEEYMRPFISDDMAMYIDYFDIPSFQEITELKIYEFLGIENVYDTLRNEKVVNMAETKSFYPDDKRRKVEIYYPRPSANYIWRGNN